MIILIFQPGMSDLGEVKTFALVASGRATNGGVNETRRWESVQVGEHVAASQRSVTRAGRCWRGGHSKFVCLTNAYRSGCLPWQAPF